MSEEAIVHRWRKPVKPLAVKDETSWATASLGRATLDYSVRFPKDDVERMRLGYVCMECWEPHEAAFPERCSLCGYAMRERQPADFHAKFKGVERDPRSVLIERELDGLDDRHERRFHETKTGIVIPRGVSNGS